MLLSNIYSADVTITDLPICVPLMQQNIHENSSNLRRKSSAAVLEWYPFTNNCITVMLCTYRGQNVEEFLPQPDVILMADVLYYDEVSKYGAINQLNHLTVTLYNRLHSPGDITST